MTKQISYFVFNTSDLGWGGGQGGVGKGAYPFLVKWKERKTNSTWIIILITRVLLRLLNLKKQRQTKGVDN